MTNPNPDAERTPLPEADPREAPSPRPLAPDVLPPLASLSGAPFSDVPLSQESPLMEAPTEEGPLRNSILQAPPLFNAPASAPSPDRPHNAAAGSDHDPLAAPQTPMRRRRFVHALLIVAEVVLILAIIGLLLAQWLPPWIGAHGPSQ